MMKNGKLFATILSLAIVCLVGFYHEAIRGYYRLKFEKWDEDALVDRPVTELEEFLSGKDIGVEQVDDSIYYALTKTELEGKRYLLRFYKGPDYRAFPFGTAINTGYAVIERTSTNDVVKKILRSRTVDSL